MSLTDKFASLRQFFFHLLYARRYLSRWRSFKNVWNQRLFFCFESRSWEKWNFRYLSAQFGAGMTHVLSDRDIFELNHKIFIRKMCGFLQYIYICISICLLGVPMVFSLKFTRYDLLIVFICLFTFSPCVNNSIWTYMFISSTRFASFFLPLTYE